MCALLNVINIEYEGPEYQGGFSPRRQSWEHFAEGGDL